eukprot:910479_1
MATTCRAMERMTNQKLYELLNGEMNYISWEQTYIQRRFYPRLSDKPNEMVLQKRFESFTKKHNGDKPLLILDVDNTILYVRFFSEELRINDICTYFSSPSVQKNNSKVIKIRLTLSLSIQNNTIIDRIHKERMDHFHWASTNKELQNYHKDDRFVCRIDGMGDIECRIQNIQISGCIIEVRDDRMNAKQIEIDFTHSNDDLNRFEPVLEREGMVPVDFIYEGFLVRVRPNLDEFMEYIVDAFDVTLYTAASKEAYGGLLQMLHVYLKQILGRDTDGDCALWNDVLFRDDCAMHRDLNGKAHYYKDLTLFGCHLSRCVMVDNSESVCRGLDPNFVFIKDYLGRDDGDDELMELYQYLDVIASIKGDIRYFLCGLEHDDDDDYLDLSTADKCLNVTNKLLDKLKQMHSEELNETASILKPLRDFSVIKKEKRLHKRRYRMTTTSTDTLLKTRRKSAQEMLNTMSPKPELMEANKRQRRNSVVKAMQYKKRMDVKDRIIVVDGNLYYNLSMRNNIIVL